MAHKLKREDFITRAKHVHGNKYNYSILTYEGTKTKTAIICKKHGIFEQTPERHMLGSGCPACGKVYTVKRTSTKEIFVNKARGVHGNRFSYTKVHYIGATVDVTITCKKHGDFRQLPSNHIQGGICPRCSLEHRSKMMSYTTSDFINKARKVHADKYDYTHVAYVNKSTPVKIRCPVHGLFLQKPKHHLRGCPCPKCSNIIRYKKKTLSQEDFIARCSEKHGYKYTYTKALYVGATSPVVITCSKHGDFSQIASVHLYGSGCPQCKASRGELRISAWLKRKQVSNRKQFRLKSCKNVCQLPFDFAILVNGHLGLIEFHGQQHDIESHFFQAKTSLRSRRKNDKIKARFCADRRVPFLVIWYYEMDNTEEALAAFISKLRKRNHGKFDRFVTWKRFLERGEQ